MSTTTTTSGRGDRTWLVALAASLWGLSARCGGARSPRSTRPWPSSSGSTSSSSCSSARWIVPAVRRVLAASTRTKVSVLVIGAGSSALATT
jgi:hypothetical protein